MTIYYVDPLNGNDTTGTGLLFASAWKSTAKAESVVAAGDTVRLCATATESITGTNTITMSTSGGTITPITWIGCDSSGNELTDGLYYTIDGSGMTASNDLVSINSRIHRRFRRISFTNAKRLAIASSADQNYTTIFDSCSFSNPSTAVVGGITSGNAYGITFINCVATGSGSQKFSYNINGMNNRDDVSLLGCTISGFSVVLVSEQQNFSFSQIVGNIFANNGHVLEASNYGNLSHICGNVFYGNTVAIYVTDRTNVGGQRQFHITNNTFVNNGIVLLGTDSTSYTMFNGYNHFFNNTTNYSNINGYTGSTLQGSHEIGGNPLFNNPSSLDFRLQSGSPLIGAGFGGANIAGLSQITSGGSTTYVVVSRRVPQRYSMPWFNRIRSVPIPIPRHLPVVRRNIVNALPKTSIRTRVAFVPVPPKTQPIVQRRLLTPLARTTSRTRTLVLPSPSVFVPITQKRLATVMLRSNKTRLVVLPSTTNFVSSVRSRHIPIVKTIQPRRTFVFVQPLKYIPMSRSRLIVRSPVVCVRRTTFVRAVTNVTQSLIVTSPRIVR